MAKYKLTPRKRLYAVWREMVKRCTVPESPHYYRYGKRGISVCDEWMIFQNFYDWAQANGYDPYAKRGVCTIERINNDGNYCPENCRWANYKEQANNKSNNYIIEYKGERKTVNEWSDIVGIKAMTIYNRLEDYGYTVAEALGFEERKDPRVGRKRPDRYTSIIQCDLDGNVIKEWPSVQIIEEVLGIATCRIWNNINGASKSCEGYIWKRKNPESKKNVIRSARAVVQFSINGEFLAEFSSAKDAAKAVSGRRSCIYQCCKGVLDTSCGYIWKFKDEVSGQSNVNPIDNYSAERWVEYRGELKRLSEWVKIYGGNYSLIRGRIDRGWPVGEALGVEPHINPQYLNRRTILQIDKEGNIVAEFESPHFVEKASQMSKSTVKYWLKKGGYDSRGYKWVYKDEYHDR